MPPTNRSPREVDTSRHFCPHTDCRNRGWLWLGNLRANGHPNGGSWRQYQCTSCQGYFPEHHGTILHGKQMVVELIVRVLACLAQWLGIRATARGFEVDPNTVLHWLVEAAEHLRAFSCYFLCDVHVKQLQEVLTHQALCLTLVTNAVSVWNTVYMAAVMEPLKEEGSPVHDSDLAHVWPTRYAHLNGYGKYHFNVEEAHQRKGLRPLRRPGNTTP